MFEFLSVADEGSTAPGVPMPTVCGRDSPDVASELFDDGADTAHDMVVAPVALGREAYAGDRAVRLDARR